MVEKGKDKMMTKLCKLLLVLALSACTVTPAPAGVLTPAIGENTVVSTVPPTLPSLDAAAPADAPWSLVAVGDSIPYNSPDDCNGCTGFVDRYAAALSKASGHPVTVHNLSEHNGLQTDSLLVELKTDSQRREALANADIIIVSIAYNDNPLTGSDDPCHASTANGWDWTKITPTCTAAAAEKFQPKLESVFAQIVSLRAGKPTIFRTINMYNDWIGGRDSDTGKDIPPEATNATRAVYDTWSAMICKAAEANSFGCADTYHAFNGLDGLKVAAGVLTASKANGHPSDKGNEVIARVMADLGYVPLVSDTFTKALPTVATPSAQTAAATAALPDPRQLTADLDKIFQDLSTANQFSGSVLIAKGGQVILSKAYGYADREKKVDAIIDTKFRIYGMTKPFTAMAILMLQEQGKLTVQDKMCIYITGCPETWKAITLQQLLTETSGIPDNSDAFIAKDITSSAPLEQMLSDAKKLPLDTQPGETFSANRTGYVWLGKIIEAVSGQTYQVFLKTNIFDPLQMSNTSFDPTQTDIALGYKDQDTGADPLNPWVLFSAAGLTSTTEDLYRFDQALYTAKLVSHQALDAIFKSYVQSDRDGFGYGYGWYVSLNKPGNYKQPGHGNGFDTTIRRYAVDKATIIILTNREDNDMPTIANSIESKLFGK
jgi:CubicO group peptidase (beta-lactamase class C family)